MHETIKRPENKKRGRKSADEFTSQVYEALRNLQELEVLETHPLTQSPAVRQLAQARYRLSPFPKGFALRHLLLEAAHQVIKDFGEIQNYRRELRFIQAFIQGDSITEISRKLRLSREHVSREVAPKGLRLVAMAFRARSRHIDEDSTTESSPGASR